MQPIFSYCYESPIGTIQINFKGALICGLSFIKGTENNVSQEKPLPQIIKKCKKQLDDYFGGKLFHFNLDFEQEGTVFQQKVWNELLKIEYGRTETYLSLSKRLGNTKVIRAAGTANGKNRIAIIVPCHRIIGSNGSLVGYSGELWRKKWLLDHEAKYANGVQSLF